MDAHPLAAIAVGILFVAGLVGSLVPSMPGPLLIFAGALLWAVVTDFATLGAGRLAILAALAVLAFVLSVAGGAIGARRYGASRWAAAGAIAGAIVGLFFGPLGLLIGPIAGAVVAEIARGATVAGGVRSGFGAVVGMFAGLVAELVISLAMIGVFLWWTWT